MQEIKKNMFFQINPILILEQINLCKMINKQDKTNLTSFGLMTKVKKYFHLISTSKTYESQIMSSNVEMHVNRIT